MTTVHNKLVDVAGAAVPGVTVRAALRAATGFAADGDSEIVQHAETTTGSDGTWTLTLSPTGGMEDPDAYYQVWEGKRIWAVTVPDSGSHFLRDVLTDPPSPSGAVLGLTQAGADARYEQLSRKGAANGYAGLGADGKVPAGQLPASSGGGGAPTGPAGGALAGTYPDPTSAAGAVTPTMLDRGYDEAGAAAAAVTAHEAGTDPHPGYLTAAEGSAAFDAAGSAAAAVAAIPSNAAAGTPALRSVGAGTGEVVSGTDPRLTNARAPLAHAGTHAAAGTDPVSPAAIGAAASGHTHTGTYDPAGAASSAVSTHEAASDPHPGYLTAAEGAAAFDAAGAASAAVAAIPSNAAAGTPSLRSLGSTSVTAAAGNDARLSDPRTPLAHASTHASGGTDPVTPAAIGAAASSHTHAESAVTGLTTDLASITSRLDALEASGGGGAAVKATATTGLLTSTVTIGIGPGWTVFPSAYRVTVAAAVGDLLVLTAQFITSQNSGDTECDVASIVGGSPARYLSSGTSTQASNGHGGLYAGSGLTSFNAWRPGSVIWPVSAADIDAGTVTLAYVARTTGSTRGVGSAAYPSQVDVVNYGPPA